MIAILSMLIDHIGSGLYPSLLWMRMAGRIAFPVFAFMICEGYFHTRSVKRYAARLGIVALISELPYNQFISGHLFDLKHQNTCFTLLTGLLVITCIEKLRNGGLEQLTQKFQKSRLARRTDGPGGGDPARRTDGPGGGDPARHTYFKWSGIQAQYLPMASVLILLAGMTVAEYSRMDYGAFGVAIILIYYFFRENKKLLLISLISVNLLYGVLNLASGYLPVQALAGLAAIPLYFYNGKKGRSAGLLFYIFYPAHLAAIAVAAMFII